MSEPKNQMEELIRTIEARGKVYWDHTEIDNKALDDVQNVFDFEVKKLEDENAKLKARNEEIEEDLWINENKVAELAYVLHRIKRYSETADVSERRIDKVISDIISFDWKKELHLKKKEQGE